MASMMLYNIHSWTCSNCCH